MRTPLTSWSRVGSRINLLIFFADFRALRAYLIRPTGQRAPFTVSRGLMVYKLNRLPCLVGLVVLSAARSAGGTVTIPVSLATVDTNGVQGVGSTAASASSFGPPNSGTASVDLITG